MPVEVPNDRAVLLLTGGVPQLEFDSSLAHADDAVAELDAYIVMVAYQPLGCARDGTVPV